MSQGNRKARVCGAAGLPFAGVAALLFTLLFFVPAALAQAVGADNTVASLPLDSHVEAFAKGLTLYLARFVESAAAIVIGIASLRGLWAYFANVLRPAGSVVPKDDIRLSLGRSLALALEFELGADILKTAVAPTWNDIGQLAAIAVLRTALNYFLEKELQQAQERNRTAAAPDS